MKVKWTEEALDRLKDINKTIEESDSDKKSNLIDQIIDKAEEIKNSPESGKVVPEFKIKQLRELKINGYSIIYFVKNSLIEILTLFDENEVSNRSKFLKDKIN